MCTYICTHRLYIIVYHDVLQAPVQLMGLYYLFCVFDIDFAARRSRNHRLNVYFACSLNGEEVPGCLLSNR